MYTPEKYDHPSEIPKRAYTGYLWSCQKSEPIFIDSNQLYDFSQWKNFPFIIEGLLYAKEDNQEHSIIIRYNNKYDIKAYDLKAIGKDAVFKSQAYLPNRFPKELNIQALKFQQVWLPEKDPLCCYMPVLQLKARLFTGFSYTSKP